MIVRHEMPKGIIHGECPADGDGQMGGGHNNPDQTCAEKDEQEAWVLVVNGAGLNADQLVSAQHTDTTFVWEFEVEE